MEYEVTDERKTYLEKRGKIVLNACPGSGKTSSIVKKIKIIQENSSSLFSNYSGIACLSFTNAATDELKEKYYKMHGENLLFPNIFSTIDSFINKYITLPYSYLLDSKFIRPKIVEDELIEKAFQNFYIDRNGNQQEGVEFPLNKFKDKASLGLYRIYPPKDIWIEMDGTFTYKGKKPSSALVDNDVFQEYGKIIFKKKISKGLITSLDSSFIALTLLSNHKRIGKYLALRFPYVIIDEAQDNSEIQHSIFDELIESGLSNVELIGDPYQSLYEWRSAKPNLFVSKFRSHSWSGLSLSENRRSNQRIINCFSILRQSIDPAVKEKNVKDLNIPITVYKYTDSNKEQIINDYCDKCENYSLDSNHIVVRGNTLKNHMIGASVPLEPWHSLIPYTILKIQNLLELQKVKLSINELRKLAINLSFSEKSQYERKEIEELYTNDPSYNSKLFKLLKLLPKLDLSFNVWTKITQELLKEELSLPYELDFNIKKRMTGFRMKDLLNENLDNYFRNNIAGKHNVPITTIHQVKGQTFDSILFFFAENSIGQNVSFNDFNKPTAFPTEKQRMIYVACSRPRQFLAIAVPEKTKDKAITDKLGNQIQIIEL
jgi:Superfamily I DNA and RNA helicases